MVVSKCIKKRVFFSSLPGVEIYECHQWYCAPGYQFLPVGGELYECRVLHEFRGPVVDVRGVVPDQAEVGEAGQLQTHGDKQHQQDVLEWGLAVAASYSKC